MADTNFTNLSVPLARQAPNFAPKLPLVNLIRNKKPSETPTKFETAVKRKFDEYMGYESSAWRELINMAQLVALFREGQQLLVSRPYGQMGYYVRPISNDDSYRQLAMNLMGFHSQVCESKIVASNPTVNMRAGDDTPQAIAAAQACRPTVDYYENEWYTSKFVRREAIDLLTNGMFIHRVRWNPFKGGMSVQERQVSQVEKQTDDGYGECPYCQFQGQASDFPDEKCPECQTPSDVKPPTMINMNQISMGQSRPIGEPEIIRCPFPAWRWDLSKDLEDSSWAIYRQRINQGVINLMLGDVIIPDSNSSDDRGLEVLHALAYAGQAFQGTALAHDTPIATPDGWKEIWELGKGDQVFSDNGKICNVTFNSGIATSRPCYEVEFSDGSVIVADEDHLWHTFTYNERARFNNSRPEWRQRRRERRARDRKLDGGKRPDNTARGIAMVESDIPLPAGEVRTTKQLLETLTLGDKKKRFNHFIRATEPLELPTQDLPIDPYHLGLWLGDGDSAGGGYTTADDELWQAFEPEFKTVKRPSPYRYYVLGLQQLLRKNGLLKNKHIPPKYLRGSFEQRLALLQGLMDTDGSCDKRNRSCEFSTVIPHLRDQVTELLVSLGIKVRFSFVPSRVREFPGGRTYKCKEAWRLRFITELPVFRLPRKLEQQKPEYRESHKWHTIVDVRPIESMPVCCIGVDAPSHLYLAGLTMIPTHNSNQQQYGGNRQNDRRPTMAEFWMSPEDYADIDIEEGETISGQTLPAGKMGKFFKDPMCFVGLNDMQVIVGVYTNESQKTEVVSGQWIMQSDSGAGRGLQDSAAVQRRFNAVDGQVYQGLAAVATPAAITDLSILRDNQGDYIFRPGVNVDVNLAMLPPGTRLQDAFYLPQAGNVSMQYMQYGSVFLKQMFQLTSFVTEFGDNGLIGVDNRTATGAQITAALANSLFGPMLATKGQSRVRIAQMIVSLEAAHNASSRYFPGKGNARGQMVSGQDLKGKVVFELVQDSELPSTPFSRQTDVRAMIESLGGPQGIILMKQQEPEMFKQFAAPFNYKPEVDSQDEVSTLCLSRVEQFQQNLRAGVADPNMLVEGLRPPVSVYERKQKEKASWFSDFLDLKQGLESLPEIRVACEQMVVLHIANNTKYKGLQSAGEGLAQGTGVMAAQAPSALGMMAMQELGGGTGQQDPAQEQQNEHEHDAALTAMEQQQEMRMKQMEIGGQESVARIQGQSQLENTRLQGENQLKVEKAKPKPVVRPAAKAS